MKPEKILVTGAQGKAGSAIVRDLREHGYEVVSADLRRRVGENPPSREVDFCDLGQTVEILSGCDAIVHMAAIPNDGITTESKTFGANTLSTYNLLQRWRA